MGLGIGDFIGGLAYGSPAQQLSRAMPQGQLAQGAPQGQLAQGGPPQPQGAAPPPQQSGPPSTAPQSPSDLGQIYLQLQQQANAAAGVDAGLKMVVASNSTPTMASALMNSSDQPRDIGSMIQNVMKIREAQTGQQEHAAAAAGGEAAFQALFPGSKPGLGTELFNLGKLPDVLSGHLTSMNPTEAEKNANAATEAYGKANPNATPADLANMKSNLLAGAMGGADLDTRQYLAAKQLDPSIGTFSDWKANNAAQSKIKTDQATNVAASRKALPSLNETLDDMQGRVNTLTSQPDIIKSITGSPNKQRLATEIFNYQAGKGGDPAVTAVQTGGLTQAEADYVINARQLHLKDYASVFSKASGGNQRISQTEAGRLGNAADQFGNFSLSPDAYLKSASQVGGVIGHARAAGYGEAQDYSNLPIDQRANLDPSYFEGGANAPINIQDLPGWARPKTVGSKAEYDALPDGQSYKTTTGDHAGRILVKGQEDRMVDQ